MNVNKDVQCSEIKREADCDIKKCFYNRKRDQVQISLSTQNKPASYIHLDHPVKQSLPTAEITVEVVSFDIR